MKVIFMGSGTSMGVPTIGCDCKVCCSENPKNKRTRASLLVSISNKNIVIDTATDFREQCIRVGLKQLHCVLYTHSHADHILGLDDLRPFCFFQKKHMPCFGNETTIENICNTFKYVFGEPQPGGSIPRIEPQVIHGPFEFDGIPIVPVPVIHGALPVNGYRIGPVSYLTDLSEIPADSYPLLSGTRVLILGVLRYAPHPTHLNYEKALAIIERLQPEQAYFTHISHDFDHDQTNAELPSHVSLAYDGLTFEISEL